METEQINYKGYTIKIVPDNDCPINPIEEDEYYHLVCWHRRYNLGNVHDFREPSDFQEWLKENPATVLPIWAYEHGNITIRAGERTYPYNDMWDSGQLGFIYQTRAEIRANFGKKRISRKLEKQVIQGMKDYVGYVDDYLQGYVYGYEVENSDGKMLDSCYGFIGHDLEKSDLLPQARSAIDYEIGKRMEMAQLVALEPAYD